MNAEETVRNGAATDHGIVRNNAVEPEPILADRSVRPGIEKAGTLLSVALLCLSAAAQAELYTIPWFVPAGAGGAPQGVLRILNGTNESGAVEIYAIDDAGMRTGPASFSLNASAAAEFTATDLQSGNAMLGLTGGIGAAVGDARLEIETDLRIVPLAYVRAADGTLSAMHDTVRTEPADGAGAYTYEVPLFNPASDAVQASRLRLINPGDAAASITIEGRDDRGAVATGGTVELTLAAGAARTLTAMQLEAGATGLAGRLGAIVGRWRLTVSSDRPIQVINTVASAYGYINNLSTTAVAGPAPAHLDAFNERFLGSEIEFRTASGDFTFAPGTGDTFTVTAERDGVTTSRTGRYGYAALGADAGRVTQSYDDALRCEANLYFATITGGWFASFCTDTDDPDGYWVGGEWSVADDDGDGGDPITTTYGVGESLPGVPSSGAFVPSVLSGGSVSAIGGGTTINLDEGGYFELSDGTRYECATSDGCAIANGTVTRGTVTGTEAGTGEVDNFPTFRSATNPGDQSYSAGTAIDTLTLPEADGGNGTLRYGLSPSVPGLSFNASARQLSGTPSTSGTYAMTYTVTDEDGDTDNLGFTITVSDGTTGTGLIGVCQVGMSVSRGQSCTYPGTTDEFSVNARGRGSFLGRLAGIRIRINNETINARAYDFEASHQGGGVWRIDRVAGITEPPSGGETENSLPSFPAGSEPDNRTYTVGTGIDPWTLPAASGGDGRLTYSLAPDVPGLSFDPVTRQLAGTPSTAASYNMTYTVTDEDGDTDSFQFAVTVVEDDETSPQILALGGCTDGRFVNDPGNNPGLVGDCRALVGFVNALARSGELSAAHALRRWGTGTQTLLASWEGIAIDQGRVTGIDLPGTRNEPGPIADIGHLAPLTGLTSLNLERNRVSDLAPLAGLTNLTRLNLFSNVVSDVSPLSGLEDLTSLGLGGNNISDISPLSTLTGLTFLDLGYNSILDISPISGLTGLTYLRLSNNSVSDISPLAGLTNLSHLSLDWNEIWNVSSLAGLTNLSRLFLARNAIEDISPLAGLINVLYLSLEGNEIGNVSSLAGLTKLSRLFLDRNAIENISPLAGLANVSELSLAGNNVGDVSSLAGLTNLTRLNLANNVIEDVAALAGLTRLTTLDLAHNAIENVFPLAGLTDVSELSLASNNIGDVSSLAGLINLTRLNLANNVIEDVAALAGLTRLTTLDLAHNAIENVFPLADLASVSELSLASNNIGDVSSLAGLINLIRLNLANNVIEDVSALAGLTRLTTLDLAHNAIENILPLLANTGLGEGDIVDASNNPLSDESINVHIATLKARGAEVNHTLSLADDFPNSRLVHVYNDNVIVMRVDEDLTDPGHYNSMDTYAADFYRWFEDEFDYLVFHSNLGFEEWLDSPIEYFGIYLSVMNDTGGIGLGRYLQNRYGSAGRLRGVIHIPTHIHGPLLHELMHAWANFAVPTSHGVHWGFSSAAGQLGGFDIATLEDLGNARWAASASPGLDSFGLVGRAGPYSPIELYLAGLAPPEDVPDLWVARDGAWEEDVNGNPVYSDNGFRVFTARNVRTWSVEDIIALNGARNPPEAGDSRHQRAAMILLTDARHPPHASVLQEMSERATRFGQQGGDGDSDYYNYYEATLGRATLTLDGLSALRKSDASAPANLPASYGTAPPPHMTTIEELCGFFASAAPGDELAHGHEVPFTGRDSYCSWSEPGSTWNVEGRHARAPRESVVDLPGEPIAIHPQ